jgi:hypothetical protein
LCLKKVVNAVPTIKNDSRPSRPLLFDLWIGQCSRRGHFFATILSREQLRQHAAVHVGEAIVATAEAECEALVVQAQKVQDRRV